MMTFWNMTFPSRRSTFLSGTAQNFQWRRILVGMVTAMGVDSHCNKILGAVVGLIAIDVMHHFNRRKAAAISLFPNKNMLEDITSRGTFVRSWVIRRKKHYVSMLYPSLPFGPGASLLRGPMARANITASIASAGITGGSSRCKQRNKIPTATSTQCSSGDPFRRCTNTSPQLTRSLQVICLVLRWAIFVPRLRLYLFSTATGADSHSALPLILVGSV